MLAFTGPFRAVSHVGVVILGWMGGRLRAAWRVLGSEFRISPWRTAVCAVRGRRILVGRSFAVVGRSRITIESGRLELGLLFSGFADPRMGGLLRIRGTLTTRGIVRVGHGNRWDIGPGAAMSVGSETYFSPRTTVVVINEVIIGERCAISWDCQLLDDDQHTLTGRPGRPGGPRRGISIGDDVLVGSRASILAGSSIGSGCVVASGSIVRGDLSEPNCLLAGSPARVVRRGVGWT